MEKDVCQPATCKLDKLKYFNQICIEEYIDVPQCHPDIEQIVSIVVDCEVISLKAINTMKGLSYEGQHLSGKKLAVEIKLRQKLLYVSDKETQSIHVIENVCYQSCYIVIPCTIEGTDPELLIRNKILQCRIVIEDIFTKAISKRKVFKNLCLLVNADITPAYELCYSIHSCKKSEICIMHNDGTQSMKLTPCCTGKNAKPLWSPLGREIAYISDLNCNQTLKIYSLKTCGERILSHVSDFHSIGSISWTADGQKLVFSGCQSGSKEIYSVNSNDTGITQLTYGDGKVVSSRPKCSPCGSMIAFIRSAKGFSDLWLMNGDGLDMTRLTSLGNIKYFDWSPDGRHIVYVCSHYDKPDRIFLTDTECNGPEEITLEGSFSHIKKIKYSPDGKYFSFVGAHRSFNDIYTFDVCRKKLCNITENKTDMDISDFVWGADSDRIYFSASDMFCCGIYSFAPSEKQKCQIFTSNVEKIELSYRGRIC